MELRHHTILLILALGAIVEKQQGYLEFTYRSDQCYVQIWSDIKTNVTLYLPSMKTILRMLCI
jgi:hypothetical protein